MAGRGRALDLGFAAGPIGVNVYHNLIGGEPLFIESLTLAEAKRRYGYEWRPGNSKTQQARSDPRLYVAPARQSTTGIIS